MNFVPHLSPTTFYFCFEFNKIIFENCVENNLVFTFFKKLKPILKFF